MPAYVNGLGVCLPNKPVHNEKIESVLGMLDGVPSPVRDVILDRNGIKWRYYAVDPETGRPSHNNAQLTVEAIRAMAEKIGLDLADVDLLACGTSSPDQVIPSHASMVHGPAEAVDTSQGFCPPCSANTGVPALTLYQETWIHVFPNQSRQPSVLLGLLST